jgi:hypothetical protein
MHTHRTPAHKARLFVHLISLALAGALPGIAQADVETEARHARQGGGLRVGTWNVRNLSLPDGGTSNQSLAFEGYFEKGLDLHLSWVNAMGFWQREQVVTEPGTVGETRYELTSYLVPATTALKVHPFTRPSSVLEPWARAGVGLVLGIDRAETSGTDPLVVPGSEMRIQTGFGIETGMGMDWRPAGAFGLSTGGGYRWVTFGESVGGDRAYQGWAFDLGVTYRFQYR